MEANAFIDHVPLLSAKIDESPGRFVREAVQASIGRTGLDLVPAAYVETQLAHHGFGVFPRYGFERLLQADPRMLCELLLCDALVYGRVTEWDRTYYGLQSVTSVGAQIVIRRASNGKIIYEAEGYDVSSRGLSKIPTGFSSLVLEPLKGLDNEILTDLARHMAERLIDPLSVKHRPEYLQTELPVILASSHDARRGAISDREILTVLMLGTPKKRATFSIGGRVRDVPMNEVAEGHYVGEFHPLAGENFPAEVIKVRLHDEFGRTSEQLVGYSKVALTRSR